MPAVTETLRVEGLGGMDDRYRAPSNRGARVRDLVWDQRGAWVDGPGYRVISQSYDSQDETYDDPFAGYAAIRSLHWFAQGSGAVQWLIWETEAGALVAFKGSGATSTPWAYLSTPAGLDFDGSSRARFTTSAPGPRSTSLAWGDVLYLVNGQNEPLVFNGRYVERAGFDAAAPRPEVTVVSSLGIPTVTTDFDTSLTDLGVGNGSKYASDNGTDSGATWTLQSSAYKYKVQYGNERGQWSPWSEASEQVAFLNTAGMRRFIRVSLPIGDSTVVARRVARTRDLIDSQGEPLSLGAAEQFYFLCEIEDNAADQFEDGIPDNALGSLIDELDHGPWPAGANIIAEFKGCMFAASTNDSIVYHSRAGHPEEFPPDNVLPMADGVGGPVVAMKATRNALVVFRRRSIHLIKGDPRQGFYAETLTVEEGCAAGRSVREIPGLGLAFLADGGVRLLQGALENTGSPTGLVSLSATISSTVSRINRSAIANACAVVNPRDHTYCLAIPVDGAADNTLLMRFHYDIGEWSYSENWPVADMVVTGDHRSYLYFGCNNTTAARGIQVVSRGWADKGGAGNIEPLYETVPHRFGALYGAVPVHAVTLSLVGTGNNVSVDVRLNQHHTLSLTADDMTTGTAGRREDTQDQGWIYSVFSTATLFNQSLTWGKYRPVTKTLGLSTMHDPHAQEIQIVIAPTSRRFELIGYDLEISGSAARKVRPLSTALEIKSS